MKYTIIIDEDLDVATVRKNCPDVGQIEGFGSTQTHPQVMDLLMEEVVKIVNLIRRNSTWKDE